VSANSGVVASALLAPLVDGPTQSLHLVHRSRAAWQLADDRGRVVLSVITPDAIRLPYAAVVPSFPRGSSPISAGGGSLGWDGSRLKVARWFEPARPILPSLHDHIDPAAAEALARRWPLSIGRGDGLTPYDDDVVCGGLVALAAAGHPATRSIAHDIDLAPLEAQTTATSAALLRLAARGYCIDPLAQFLTAIAVDLDAGGSPTSPGGAASCAQSLAALLEVGGSSGRGLAEGVMRVLEPHASRLVAA
jgi:hypothetical protein